MRKGSIGKAVSGDTESGNAERVNRSGKIVNQEHEKLRVGYCRDEERKNAKSKMGSARVHDRYVPWVGV